MNITSIFDIDLNLKPLVSGFFFLNFSGGSRGGQLWSDPPHVRASAFF